MDKLGRRKTIVFVTDQFQCERIIKAGKVISDITHTELAVCSISRAGTESDPAALQHLFNVTKAHGSEMHVLYAEEVYPAMEELVREGNTVNVITGEPGGEHSPLQKLWRRFEGTAFFTVDPAGSLHRVERTGAGVAF